MMRLTSASFVSAPALAGFFDITERFEAALDICAINCGDELALDGDTEALAACRGSQSPR